VKESSKDRPTLKVETAEKRLVPALEAIGFRSVKARPRALVVNVNDETEVFLYPGVGRRWGSVVIDPIIGVDNLRLKARLLHSGWEGDPRVCHVFLGMAASWRSLYVQNEEELEHAVQQVVHSAIEMGLPLMRQYDSLDKVRKLFQDCVAHKQVPVAVLFAKEKLERMQEH
jgi:hypothetical protein